MVSTYKKNMARLLQNCSVFIDKLRNYPSRQWIWCQMKGRTNEGWPDIKNKLNITTDHKIISLMIKRTNITKHMMTSTVAHITIPPFFWVLSACMSHKPNNYHRGKVIREWVLPNKIVEISRTFCSCLSPSSTVVATFWML